MSSGRRWTILRPKKQWPRCDKNSQHNSKHCKRTALLLKSCGSLQSDPQIQAEMEQLAKQIQAKRQQLAKAVHDSVADQIQRLNKSKSSVTLPTLLPTVD